MATVKLNAGGKVLTKGGKVSCGCCSICALYSSFGLFDGLMTLEDYPDSVIFSAAGESATLTRQTPGVLAYGGDWAGIAIGINAFNNGAEPYFNIWSVDTELGSSDMFFASLACNTINDDVDSSIFNNQASVTVDFANSYTINGPISGAVTKTGLENTVFDGILFTGNYAKVVNDCFEYLGNGLRLIFNGLTYKWEVNGNPKIGLQNTPVGSYEGGYSVS